MTDAGLAALGDSKSLKELIALDTAITQGGADAFEAAHPTIKVTLKETPPRRRLPRPRPPARR